MASACGAAGAQIVIWGRDEAKNEGAAAGLREAGITPHGFVCDVTEPDQVASVWERSVEAAGGRIDSVFANAGPTGRRIPFLEVSLPALQLVMRTHVDGVFPPFQTAARHTTARGGGSPVAVS